MSNINYKDILNPTLQKLRLTAPDFNGSEEWCDKLRRRMLLPVRKYGHSIPWGYEEAPIKDWFVFKEDHMEPLSMAIHYAASSSWEKVANWLSTQTGTEVKTTTFKNYLTNYPPLPEILHKDLKTRVQIYYMSILCPAVPWEPSLGLIKNESKPIRVR